MGFLVPSPSSPATLPFSRSDHVPCKLPGMDQGFPPTLELGSLTIFFFSAGYGRFRYTFLNVLLGKTEGSLFRVPPQIFPPSLMLNAIWVVYSLSLPTVIWAPSFTLPCGTKTTFSFSRSSQKPELFSPSSTARPLSSTPFLLFPLCLPPRGANSSPWGRSADSTPRPIPTSRKVASFFLAPTTILLPFAFAFRVNDAFSSFFLSGGSPNHSFGFTHQQGSSANATGIWPSPGGLPLSPAEPPVRTFPFFFLKASIPFTAHHFFFF